MATPLTHALVSVGLGRTVPGPAAPWRFWLAVGVCATIADRPD